MSADGYLIAEPMRLVEAEAWVVAKLGPTPRAVHSRFVGTLMRAFATAIAPDEAELWEITGLLHDLDYFVVDGDWPIHGRTTVAWLERRLPLPALVAIAAHDHRSGIVSDITMARALRLADALAVFDEGVGRERLLEAMGRDQAALATLAGTRPYLALTIAENGPVLGLSLEDLAGILRRQTAQDIG